MTLPTDPLEVLIAARAKITAPDMWCKGSYVSLDGAMCIVGALEAVTPGGDEAMRLACRRALLPHCPGGVISFNDESETTHADVLAAFDRAIAALTPPAVRS